jgi:hypothetical protein
MQSDLLVRFGADAVRTAAHEPKQSPDAGANLVTAE